MHHDDKIFYDFAGKILMPRDFAEYCFNLTGWRNYELTKALATGLGESRLYVGAWHDNMGEVASRDCGLFQINIPASQIGTPAEDALRTESLIQEEWEPVAENNISEGWAKYNARWIRNGKEDIRRWQAWVAYTSGWATFPEFWVWAQDANGVPIGAWRPTGRYIHKAIAGQMNRHIIIVKDWSAEVALSYGKKYATHFGVDPSALVITKSGVLGWKVPPMPTDPPADGIGPRPKENNGV